MPARRAAALLLLLALAAAADTPAAAHVLVEAPADHALLSVGDTLALDVRTRLPPGPDEAGARVCLRVESADGGGARMCPDRGDGDGDGAPPSHYDVDGLPPGSHRVEVELLRAWGSERLASTAITVHVTEGRTVFYPSAAFVARQDRLLGPGAGMYVQSFPPLQRPRFVPSQRALGRFVAMIPARAGSQRLRMKNWRLLAGKPVIQHVIEAAQAAGVFDRIVVNSDAPALRAIADRCGVEFYQRPAHLGSSSTRADDVVADFMANFPGETLVWVNPTSPLQPAAEIAEVVRFLARNPDVDTLITSEELYRHATVEGEPVNFDPQAKGAKTQDLPPVNVAVYSIIAWRYDSFQQSFLATGAGYFSGTVRYFPVSVQSAAAVLKKEQDLHLAAAMLRAAAGGGAVAPTPRAEPGPLGWRDPALYDPAALPTLREQIAAAEAESPRLTFAPTPAPAPERLVFIFSTYSSQPHTFIEPHVRRALELHPSARVFVVDNGSPDRSHVAALRAIPGVTVELLPESRYELGAYAHVYNSRDDWGDVDAFVCLQDMMELQHPLPVPMLLRQDVTPLFYFWGSEVEEPRKADKEAWVEAQLLGLGLAPVRAQSSVFANAFAASAAGMRRLSELGLFDVVTDAKHKSQACERLLGAVFEQLGFAPLAAALASGNGETGVVVDGVAVGVPPTAAQTPEQMARYPTDAVFVKKLRSRVY